MTNQQNEPQQRPRGKTPQELEAMAQAEAKRARKRRKRLARITHKKAQ